MNYKEARVYLESLSKYGSVLGLENMRELLRRLDSPHDRLRFIHIAGTNGKGSVLAYLSRILSSAGYRTGKYVSPTLLSYRERIQVDDCWIDRDSVAAVTTKVRQAVEEMKEETGMQPTVFEVETAMAFLYFVEQDCDIVILETGLGGRLDATNIIPAPEVAVLTSISEDHIGVIGDSLDEIVHEKAGIVKDGCSLVVGPQSEQVEDLLKHFVKDFETQGVGGSAGKKAELANVVFVDRNRAELISADEYGMEFCYGELGSKSSPLKISMPGIYQLDNAITAIEVIEAIKKRGFFVAESAIREGLLETIVLGRFTRVSAEPDIILDGAHNPAGARALRKTLESIYPARKIFSVFGVFADKDYEAIIAETAGMSEGIWTVELPDKERGLDPDKLAEIWNEISGKKIAKKADSVAEAVQSAVEAAQRDGVVLCYGSLSYLGEAYIVIKGQEDKGDM